MTTDTAITSVPPACGQSHLADAECRAVWCTAQFDDVNTGLLVTGHWHHPAQPDDVCRHCSKAMNTMVWHSQAAGYLPAGHCSDHCPRLTCGSCGARDTDINPTITCDECEECSECCTCSVCGACDTRSRDTMCSRCDNCSNCCECMHCRNCGPVEYTCERCERCDSGSSPCCQCARCDVCENLVAQSDYCTRCNRCDSCGCECESDDDTESDYSSSEPVQFRSPSQPAFHTSDADQLTRNPSTRYAALEIEIAQADNGTAISQVARNWDAGIVRDGSLPSGGFEINTAPANGDLLLRQIEEWADALEDQSATVTSDCGLHVHVDTRDFTYSDMRRLILLYAKLEPALFAMVPRTRRTSQWCQPCGTEYATAVKRSDKPEHAEANIVAGVYNVSPSDTAGLKQAIASAKNNKYASERYHALNIHSWFFRGTIECRLHTGTTSATKLANWALLWVAIVDCAYQMSDDGVTNLEGTPADMLCAIAPTPAIAEWITARIAKWRNN